MRLQRLLAAAGELDIFPPSLSDCAIQLMVLNLHHNFLIVLRFCSVQSETRANAVSLGSPVSSAWRFEDQIPAERRLVVFDRIVSVDARLPHQTPTSPIGVTIGRKETFISRWHFWITDYSCTRRKSAHCLLSLSEGCVIKSSRKQLYLGEFALWMKNKPCCSSQPESAEPLCLGAVRQTDCYRAKGVSSPEKKTVRKEGKVGLEILRFYN